MTGLLYSCTDGHDPQIDQPGYEQPLTALLEQQVYPFHNQQPELTHLSNWIGDSQFVLLGDSTHGSQEFYQIRAEITKYLIKNKGFTTLIIEGNWPGGNRVNQFIHDQLSITEHQALEGFKPILPWVWRNEPFADLVKWLHAYNRNSTDTIKKVSFYGIDLFSLYPSMTEVLNYLQKYYPDTEKKIRTDYQCFDDYKNNAGVYGQTIAEKPGLSCEKQASRALQFFNEPRFVKDSAGQSAAFFNALMNAETVKAAEQYFRLEYQDNKISTWNIRENFMMTLINSVLQQQATKIQQPKVILWAHNSHIGDARSTFMSDLGEISLGQLLRQHYGAKNVFLLGALTYQGKVVASSDWNGSAQCMDMPAAPQGSYAALFEHIKVPRFILNLQQNKPLAELLNKSRLQRFVGVVYNPAIDNPANYGSTRISTQFDAIMFVNTTQALKILDNPCK